MNYSEQAITINCAQETLVGVLAVPELAKGSIGVVVIVGGPQYRAGSHRQFVLLSRALATAGYPVLRFDYRGMGDSSGDLRDFSDVSPDIGAAIDTMLHHLPYISKVALWGLCDGASAALLYCDESNDARVSGMCLLNPWVRSEASLARTQVKHYYLQRLRQREFWAKLFRGDVAWKALTGLARNIALTTAGGADSPAGTSNVDKSNSTKYPFQQRMASAWSHFDGSIMLLLSGDDYTAKEFLEYASNDSFWKNAFVRRQLVRHDIPNADHTFSDAAHRRLAEELSLQWLASQGNGEHQ